MKSYYRHHWIVVLLFVFVPVSKNLAAEVHFSIPEISADNGLKLYVEQAGRQVLFPYDLMSRYYTNAVQGSYHVDEALQLLLADTGLEAVSDETGTLTIRILGEEKEMTAEKNTIFKGVAAFLASVFITSPVVAQAQQAEGAAVLEEIIVTAQKREQSVQDVGLTITAFTGDRYRELSRGTLDGLAAQISNVQAYSSNTYLESVHIRGIGLNEFQGQYDSPVAQHFDEVYIAKPWMKARRHYDIGRVEVLKGPQGTLFGRNTTGGSLNFYTKAPVDRFEAELEAGIDEHERYRLTGMINGPLSDELSGRFSFNTELGSGGPQKNLFSDDEHGRPDLLDFRGQLLWTGEKLTMRALVHGGTNKSDKTAWKGPGIFNLGAPGLCPQLFTGEVSKNPSACAKTAGFAILNGHPEGEFEPEGIHTINQNKPPTVDDTFYGGFLRFDYEVGDATLTSITAYEYYERVHNDDSQADIFNSTSTHYYDEMNQVSQELRLTGNLDSRWRYILGFFYENDDLDQVDGSDLSQQQLPGVAPPFADQFFAQFGIDTESIAVFAHNEFDFTENVTLNLGLRYTDDTIKVNDALLGIGLLPQTGKEKAVTPCLVTTYPAGPVGSPACPFLGPHAPLFNDSRTDRDFSWRVGIEWKASDDFLVYTNLTTGYRSGGYSLPFAGAATEFDPEELLAMELGFKYQLLDDRLRINASAFRYVYDNVQVNVDDPISPLVPITRNIGEQLNTGFEADITWQPVTNLYLRQSVGYLDAEFNDTPRQVSTYLGPIALEGKRPVNSPEWTYNGAARYQQQVADGWDVIIGVDYRWIGERFLEATGQLFDRAEDYWVANMRVAVASQDEKWEVAVYGTNLFDEEYLTYINNIGFFKLDIFGERQTFGASVRYRFQ